MEALKIIALSVIIFASFLIGGVMLTILVDLVRHLEAHFRGGYVLPGTTLSESFVLLPKFLKAAIARIPTVEGPMVGFLWRRTKNVLFLVGLAQAVAWADGHAGGRLTASAKSGRDRAVAWWTSKPEDRLGPLARQVWERLARAEGWMLNEEDAHEIKSVVGDLLLRIGGEDKAGPWTKVYTGNTDLTGLVSDSEQYTLNLRAREVRAALQYKRQEALAAQLAAGPFPAAGNGGGAGGRGAAGLLTGLSAEDRKSLAMELLKFKEEATEQYGKRK